MVPSEQESTCQSTPTHGHPHTHTHTAKEKKSFFLYVYDKEPPKSTSHLEGSEERLVVLGTSSLAGLLGSLVELGLAKRKTQTFRTFFSCLLQHTFLVALAALLWMVSA